MRNEAKWGFDERIDTFYPEEHLLPVRYFYICIL